MLSIRKIGVIGRTYRHLTRYRQILGVFFKYGFGDFIERLKIDQYIEIGLQMIAKDRRPRVERLAGAQRLRMAIEELGPTYIKLGQILSTRPDLIPPDVLSELAKLQDHVPPRDYHAIRQVFEDDFGQFPEKLFQSFSETPFASASIGQVYQARLKDGEQVAVKVQRPGVNKTIEIDLEIMLHLATLMESHIEEMVLHQPVKIVDEFAKSLEREIDYTIEASNMERIAQLFLDDHTLYIPKVFRELTTSQIITMEFVEGVKVSDIQALSDMGLDRKRITQRGADICLTQIFYHGFFHADPHPGNIFVLPQNVICLIDFGMVGSVDRQTRENFVDLIENVVNKDDDGTTRVLVKLALWDDEPDLRILRKDVSEFINEHVYKPLKDIDLSKVLSHLLELTSRNQLRIPPDLFLMMKALGTLEGVAAQLDPDFNLISQSVPFLEQVKLNRYHPERISGDMMRLGSELLDFLHRFPNDLLEIARLAKQKKLTVNIRHTGLAEMRATNDRTSNRISFAIVIASLLIGSAIIINSEIPPFVYGISLIGIIGFSAAAVMGIWLLIAILRKGRL
ncbi:AarF/ABC1/UbiB kinase family protein [Desulfococcaceae bacterium HSG9]|nr:AarF/ABC1/UbiB kinase family protein [Desulfococcaceae bacterium HSG9]